MSLRTLYLRASSYSIAAKLLTTLASLAVLWQINMIAGKDVFGLVMLAYALNYILGSAVATLFQTIMMFHVSRDHEEDAPPVHLDKVGAALFYGLAVGILFALAETFAANALARTMDKPEAALWFALMAWMIPVFAVNSILTTWYRARQDVPTMVLYFEVLPAALRVLMLAGLMIFVLPHAALAWVYILSFLLPFMILYLRHPVRPRLYGRFSLWDLQYGVQNMLTQLMTKSLRNIVIFLIGFFASAGVVADYTLAMRFGQFLQIPKLALTQLQVPRMGAYMKKGQTAMLQAEFDAMRMLGLSCTILGAAFFIVAAPFVFSFFGDYASAVPVFLILAISSIILTGFGAVGGYLSIAGYAGLGLVINLISLVILIFAIIGLVPDYAGEGAAVATVIGSFTSMALMAAAIFMRDRVNTQSIGAVLAMSLSSLLIACYILELVSDILASTALLVLTGYGLYLSRPAFIKIFGHTKKEPDEA